MNKLCLSFAVTCLLLCGQNASAITPEEIKTLAKIGVAADEMIKAIERDRTVFRLTVSQILDLKKSGIPDKVLKFMLKTPQLYSKKGKTGDGNSVSGVTGSDASIAATPEEMTAEERAALEARQRVEAERLAQEARNAEDAQRRAFAEGTLKKGMDLAKSGDCVPAIITFLDFIASGDYTRGTPEHYKAWYGIAHALSQCGMYQSAARYLVDVVLEGPERPFFQQAYWELRKIRKRINYSPPDLEELTRFPVVSFSKRFQDEYNYFLGEFYYDYNDFSKALTYFEQVSEGAPDYGKAIYLTGLVQVQNNLFRSAVQSFQNAITSTEANDSDPEVSDLAYLALARIAYESENFDAAIFYYRKVPPNSNKIATAFYESAWTYFVKGDYSRALGTFQVLHSPFFEHYFYPELWILESTVYVNLCHYTSAREAIQQFNTQVNALAIPLKRLLAKLRRPQDYFNALKKIAEGDQKLQVIDRRIVYPVLANVEFYNLYKTVKQIQWEEDEIAKVKGQLGQFGEDLHRKLGALRLSGINAAGIKVQQVLKQVEAELADYAVKVTEIEVDLSAEEIMRQTRELQGVTEEVKPAEAEGGGARAIVGSDSMSWKFEGEYWKDAIGGFRSFLKSKCVK
jgi:tetratricopeptide (TPR) repeat protein